MEKTTRQTELEILAHNLLWLRNGNGYSQRRMARCLKIGVVTLRRLEHAELSPRLGVEFLFEIQAFWNFAIGHALGMDGIKIPRISNEIRGILLKFSSGVPR